MVLSPRLSNSMEVLVENVRKQLIDSHIAKLGFKVQDPVRHGRLRALHAEGDFAGMASLVRGSMNLDMRLRLGLVNSGGPPRAPAWVSMPVPMPPYKTRQFRETVVTIYLRKAFLREFTFETAVCAIAHEMSHIVLSAIGHTLQNSEEAVDLTAMMLGYRDFYRIANTSEQTEEYIATRSYGYLSPEEVTYAANVIAGM